MCRNVLLRNFFNKPFSCNMTKSDSTAGFVWVPTGVYINKNYEQMLITNLTNDNLHMAFACAFMLEHLPNDMYLSFSSDLEEYYYQRVKDMYCSSYKLTFEIDVMFMTKCGHFLHNIYTFMQQQEKKRATKKH